MKLLLASALALGVSASAASAAPLELGDAELDSVTAGLIDPTIIDSLTTLLATSGPLLTLNVDVPIDIRDVNVTIRDVNVNAVVNAAVVAPILSSGTDNVTIRQRGRVRFRRR